MNGREAYQKMTSEGIRARLPDWPVGQYVKCRSYPEHESAIALYQDHALLDRDHAILGREFRRTDWEVYSLPEGIEEKEE
jgi:hypothetical protein